MLGSPQCEGFFVCSCNSRRYGPAGPAAPPWLTSAGLARGIDQHAVPRSASVRCALLTIGARGRLGSRTGRVRIRAGSSLLPSRLVLGMRTARTRAVVALVAYCLVAGGCAGPDTVTEPTITVTSTAAAAHPTAHVAPAHPTKAPTAVPIPVTSGFNHAAAKAAGATAICRDGSWSYSAHRGGACSHHRGVIWWTGNVGPAGP